MSVVRPVSMEDYYKLFNLDMQSLGDFQRESMGRTVSLDLELGVIFSLLRFSNHDLDAESWNEEMYNRDLFEEAVCGLNNYGVTMQSPACFIQGVEEQGFNQFIKNWVQHQGENPLWNPDYAPLVSVSPQVKEYCADHDQTAFLGEFNVIAKMAECWESHWADTTKRDYVLYPFDGWTLAQCIELTYSSK